MSSAARAAKQAVKLAAAAGDKVVGPLRGPRILIYHQVGAGTGLEMEVTTDDFRRQLDWLGDNGEVVDLETRGFLTISSPVLTDVRVDL